MLLSFRVANHRSLKDEQQLLLVPPDDGDLGTDNDEPQVLPVAGIFGPNASGKSNVLDALAFMSHMVRFSMQDSEPDAGIERHPFALNPVSLAEPSTYVVDLWTKGNDCRYTYGFAIDDAEVVEEWMYVYVLGERQTIFERDRGDYVFPGMQSDSVAQIQEITEDNALFLTVAARSKQAAVRPVYDWFSRRMRARIPGPSLLTVQNIRPPSDDALVKGLEGLLRAADTGIERLEIKRHRPTDDEVAEVEERYANAPEEMKRIRVRSLERGEFLFHHRTGGGDDLVPLGIRQQSQGTIALLTLGQTVMSALRTGSLLLVDELDANLHPHLSAKIIDLFENPVTNPKGSQLIFSSHDSALLGWIRGKDALRREEIWFVEKDEEGASQLFSLSDYEDEGEENRALWYLTGRYGAVPEVADDEFDAVVQKNEEQEER